MLELSGVGVVAAFLAGAISSLSPCVLPLVPGYVSDVAGHSASTVDLPAQARRRQALGTSLGFATIFMIMGASATALARCSGATAMS